MSTDDQVPAPRTRAEARAAREAAAAAQATAAQEAGAQVAGAATAAVPEDVADEAAVRDVPVVQPVAAVPVAAAPAAESVEPRSEPVAVESASVLEPEVTEPEATESESFTPASAPASAPASRRLKRRFVIALAAVLGVLVLVGTALGIVSLMQGPRLTSMQVDPAHAIEAAGSRIILTANQSLAAIDESQVTVEPEVPFTVDASGRGIGIRFTVPLDDDTKYTVSVADVTGASGGPATTLTTSFVTPPSEIFLLRRDAEGDDTIFVTDLGGEKALPVFVADKINDFRATSNKLVVSVETPDGSQLLVMDRDGSNELELPLPGDGYIGAIQVSDRGGLVGYSYSDRELSDTEGRASVLVTQSLSGDDEPRVIEVNGAEANIFVWEFVPDSSAVLFIDFDGALSLVDRSVGDEVRSLGLASNLQGISRGTYRAIVERVDGTVVELDLADGAEQPLAASVPDFGAATSITPFPGGTLRHVVARNEGGIPTGQAILLVDDDGVAEPLVEVGPGDTIVQACASPSGQYAAVVIAPKLSDNPYDQLLLPLPQNLETHLIDLATGDEMVALTGFDASWCHTAPRF